MRQQAKRSEPSGRPHPIAGVVAIVLAIASAATAQQSIVTTRHNLSATGPGPLKAASENQICIFCHAPHNSRVQTPLWNRQDSTVSYLTYASSTFQGSIAQPNGSTKLCLSCHDGTIALGSVVSRSQEMPMAGGNRTIDPSRPTHIGSNLRDDHPVSFHYASSRGGSGIGFNPPSGIAPPVTLDHNGDMQCTSCHDPHDDTNGTFLRTSYRNGHLCLACHNPEHWGTASHKLASATWNGMGENPWPRANYGTVGENACLNCHTPHGAGSQFRILNFAQDEANCARCHNGNVARKDIIRQINKPYAHPVVSSHGVHDPIEDPLTMPRHVECQDCHDPHTARSGTAAAPSVPGPLFGAKGVDTNGSPVARISFGYEVCYRCHADNNSGSPYISRLIPQTNVRLEFDPSNPSSHPIEATGRNLDMPSLRPGWSPTSRVACWDCHVSDEAPSYGGTGPAGPHGSIHQPLLGAFYNRQDNIRENAGLYALCYNCHSRASILNDESFGEHERHLDHVDTGCSTCHDPHGISSTQGNSTNHTHLINFNTAIVSPNPNNGRLEFVDLGRFRGRCTLMCHGEVHNNREYPR